MHVGWFRADVTQKKKRRCYTEKFCVTSAKTNLCNICVKPLYARLRETTLRASVRNHPTCICVKPIYARLCETTLRAEIIPGPPSTPAIPQRFATTYPSLPNSIPNFRSVLKTHPPAKGRPVVLFRSVHRGPRCHVGV